MRVLVIGGAGYVGGLVLPHLAARHEVRVLDLKPPTGAVEYVHGDATEPACLAGAVDGMDTVVHCAMGRGVGDTTRGVLDAFDVNVKSVHLALLAAHAAGVPHAVHVSSMSVYRDLTGRRLDESTPADATDLYGLTKRFGEEVCRAAVAEWGMSVNVLRLAWPTLDDTWPSWGYDDEPGVRRTPDGTRIHATAASDVAAALLAALAFRDGYQVFTITGDTSARLWSTERARRLLGWAPQFSEQRADGVDD
jgi:nucleoside-diphosphate-sugar epimerase